MSLRKLFALSFILVSGLLGIFPLAAKADGDHWAFSVYDYQVNKFITVGPFPTKAECEQERRDGYQRNDRYRNDTDCI